MPADDARIAPFVSVIVACTRPALVDGIAAALGDQAGSVGCELVVVGSVAGLDPASWSVPGRVIECTDTHPNVRRCLGIAASSGPIVAFLDDDARPQPGWIAAAAALDPAVHEIWTGPEEPTRSGRGARLAYAAASTWLADAAAAHITRDARLVRWSDAPFCNLVVARALIDHIGPPSTTIAWDLDDFEFCRRADLAGATFVNRPDLRILHDRYPDRIVDWLVGKARIRRRTGEKVVTHPELYFHIPGAVIATFVPPAALAATWAARRRAAGRRAVVGAMFGYVAAVAVSVLRTPSGRGGEPRPNRALVGALLIAYHGVSVAAFQVGLIRQLWRCVHDRVAVFVPSRHDPRRERRPRWLGRC